jgi:hypothetical protein
MLIPGSNDCRLVLDDDSADFIQLSRAEPMIPRQADRRQPELRVLTIAADVHVHRFIAVEAVEKEPVRAGDVRNARHSVWSQNLVGFDRIRLTIRVVLRQRLDDLADTLANLKKNVRDWLQDSGDAVDGTALPPFSVSHLPWTSF